MLKSRSAQGEAHVAVPVVLVQRQQARAQGLALAVSPAWEMASPGPPVAVRGAGLGPGVVRCSVLHQQESPRPAVALPVAR